MPHLSDESASGAASSTSLRSSSRMARRCVGCWAKKPSIAAPKSARGAGLFTAALFTAALFATGFVFATGLFAAAGVFVFVLVVGEALFGFWAFFWARF